MGLRFLVISDWGGKSKPPYATDAERLIGQGMGKLAEKYDSSFVLSLGDHFRDKGVARVDDVRFKVSTAVHCNRQVAL